MPEVAPVLIVCAVLGDADLDLNHFVTTTSTSIPGHEITR